MAQIKKRKKFFDVEMPIVSKDTQLQAYNIEELQNKYITYDLTRLLRGKSMEITLKVVVEGDKITTTPYKIKLMPYFLQRMMRKATNYIESSFSAKCKNSQLRIKPFLITRKKVSRAVRNSLRNKAKDEISEYIKEMTFEEVFDEVIKNKLQKTLSLKLKKIYPLSLCEIRIMKVEKGV